MESLVFFSTIHVITTPVASVFYTEKEIVDFTTRKRRNLAFVFTTKQVLLTYDCHEGVEVANVDALLGNINEILDHPAAIFLL